MKKTLALCASLLVCLSGWSQPRRPQQETLVNPWVHDPVVAWEDSVYHIYATGNGISHLTSRDLTNWRIDRTPTLNVIPGWATDSVPGLKAHLWAPDIIQWKGRWYMAYSCSTFGKNTSAIGLVSRQRLNSPEPWLDHGCIVASKQHRDEWNAIDPNFVIDKNGTPWLTWGSFWDGLQLVRLDSTLHMATGAKPVTIARRYKTPNAKGLPENPTSRFAGPNAIEAPFIYQREGWYYLFASWDYCCQGSRSTYHVVVGRSKDIEGPYVDRDGKAMTDGGGTLVIEGDKKDFDAIGHCAVYDLPDGTTRYFSHGYSRAANGAAVLVQRKVTWDKKGWPVLSPVSETN